MSSNQNEKGITLINGAQLYYELQGQGEALLLIHAGVADSRMFDEQMAAFAERFRVVRFDLRGFGRSNMPAGSFANVDDVAALLDQVGAPSAHLLGISFGGLIGLDFALAYPKRVQRLVLGAPSVSGSKASKRIKSFWEEEDALIEAGDFDAATEVNLRAWVDGIHRTPEQVDPAVREQVRLMQRHIFDIPMPADDEIEERPLSPPASERLSDIQAETLILVGDLDLPEKMTLAEQLANKLPKAAKGVIPNVAHMLNMEAPAAFNQLVLDFLNQ